LILFILKELIGSAKRRKQFMILGGLCLLAVLVIVAIVLSIVLINRSKDETLEEVKLDDILRGTLQPKRFNGTWINDNSFYYFDDAVRRLLPKIAPIHLNDGIYFF
jgi:hypothetical protein